VVGGSGFAESFWVYSFESKASSDMVRDSRERFFELVSLKEYIGFIV